MAGVPTIALMLFVLALMAGGLWWLGRFYGQGRWRADSRLVFFAAAGGAMIRLFTGPVSMWVLGAAGRDPAFGEVPQGTEYFLIAATIATILAVGIAFFAWKFQWTSASQAVALAGAFGLGALAPEVLRMQAFGATIPWSITAILSSLAHIALSHALVVLCLTLAIHRADLRPWAATLTVCLVYVPAALLYLPPSSGSQTTWLVQLAGAAAVAILLRGEAAHPAEPLPPSI